VETTEVHSLLNDLSDCHLGNHRQLVRRCVQYADREMSRSDRNHRTYLRL